MNATSYRRRRRLLYGSAVIVFAVVIAAIPAVHAQAPTTSSDSRAQTSSPDQRLAAQIEELRAQVARLQAALDQQRSSSQSATPSSSPNQPPSPMRMGDMDKMSKTGTGEMGGKPGGGMAPMDMHKGEMGMPPDGMKMPGGMMDDMGRMSSANPAATGAAAMPPSGGMSMGGNGTKAAPGGTRSMSALPGVPGASHLYHIGSTGFFLDQPQLTLTPQQQSALNAIKERALLERGNAERRVEQGEQELWALTGADQPDATKIQGKAREIEQARTNQRLAFIQSVGEATKLLTPEQRTQLLGMPNMPAK